MGVEISLTGKNAIVTGGGGGMGRCTARMLARAGANVLVSDMDGAAAEETVAQIKAESDVKALSMVCNVTSKADIDRMVAAALDAFGRIDILNHIAGVFGAVDFLEATEADYDKQQHLGEGTGRHPPSGRRRRGVFPVPTGKHPPQARTDDGGHRPHVPVPVLGLCRQHDRTGDQYHRWPRYALSRASIEYFNLYKEELLCRILLS